MSIRRIVLPFAVAFITLSSVATATPFPPATNPVTAPSASYAGRHRAQTHFVPKPYDRYYGIDRTVQPEKAARHFIPKPYDRYYGIDRRVKPTPHPPFTATASREASLWPLFTVAAVLLFAIAGAALARIRHTHRTAV
jgi:hypothetical protein